MFNRRHFLAIAAAAALLPAAACAQPAPAPPLFAPTRLSVQVRGSGPDVILIPGLTGSREVWSGVVAGVPGYRYHLVQVAGFAGEPARGNAGEGPVAAPVAEELARYIKSRGLEEPAVVGHSMGGVIAMMLAARHPESVGEVMVVDILPDPSAGYGGSAAALGPLADSLLGMLSGTPEGRNAIKGLMERFGGAAATNSDPDVVARATHELATTDLTPALPRIAAPLTVVYALDPDSPRTPAQTERLYAAAYAGAKDKRLIAVPRSGHMVMLDQPVRFAAELKAFLGR